MSQPRSSLTALSPLDGRYADKLAPLADCFSELALIRERVAVEVEYLIALLAELKHPAAGKAKQLRALYETFSQVDGEAVKQFEKSLRHDVKAVEYWLKERVSDFSLELVHLGLTSEDVNNLAYARMHHKALKTVIEPSLGHLLNTLGTLSRAYGDAAMLARTHGQPASPTTMGKELGVFAVRLANESRALATHKLPGKLGGATGTLAALALAYPDHDWLAFSRRFIRSLGFEPSTVTTQIEPADGYAACYDHLRRINHVLLDLCQDLWRYISDGYFRQKALAGEIGSSAMPHKVNPIDFENAEGNLGLANALLAHLGDKLTVSRLQRDLSGSTVMRNAGVAFGHCYMALWSIANGLVRIDLDRRRLADELAEHPEVLSEAIQTVLRAEGVEVPYEHLMALTRGRQVTLDELLAKARELAPGRAATWDHLTPASYVGLAARLADEAGELALETARTLIP